MLFCRKRKRKKEKKKKKKGHTKLRKNLISTVIHLTRYIEVVLMRMVPHTFSHMEQNSTSISDSN